MRVRPVHYLAAGLMLVGLCAAGLISPTIQHFIDNTAARIGAGLLAWTLVLTIAFGLILASCAAIRRDLLIRGEILRQQQSLAAARSVSLFSDEALAGVIGLGDMGRQVEVERQGLNVRSGALALTAVAALGLGGGAVAQGLQPSGSLPGAMIALLATTATAAILLGFARLVRRTARTLAPTQAQVHAALARHQEREEAERRLIRPNLALAGAVLAEPPRTTAECGLRI